FLPLPLGERAGVGALLFFPSPCGRGSRGGVAALDAPWLPRVVACCFAPDGRVTFVNSDKSNQKRRPQRPRRLAAFLFRLRPAIPGETSALSPTPGPAIHGRAFGDSGV